MSELDAFSLNSSQVVFGLVAFFIVNVIINLFLINKIFEERRLRRKIARQQKDDNTIIQAFLDDQHKLTRTHNRMLNKQVSLDKEVVYLRTAYMKVESNAIPYRVDTDPYWQYIT